MASDATVITDRFGYIVELSEAAGKLLNVSHRSPRLPRLDIFFAANREAVWTALGAAHAQPSRPQGAVLRPKERQTRAPVLHGSGAPGSNVGVDIVGE